MSTESTETLEMESRLKNYISGELENINASLRKTEGQAATSFENVGKSTDAASEFMTKFDVICRLMGLCYGKGI